MLPYDYGRRLFDAVSYNMVGVFLMLPYDFMVGVFLML